ncbi:MAG: phenylalanine--tRNA ligase beta subunit-related protein [Candidatus Pacebacteria bacterium]|nr:phenylalanine--tRNA ligase beta subunit-related protein [Candidatus Paceibacterota bacterium]
MLISYNWLQTYFDTKLPTPDELAEKLTFHSFEIEGVEKTENDTVIDVDVLPNRAHDCLSHRGIAKELSVLFEIPLNRDVLREDEPEFSESKLLSVDIEDSLLCRRYSAAVIRGVKVAPSPEWLKARLEALGQRSINNIVDATNYVMFGLGQPLHAFDMKKLEERDGAYRINVRSAHDGESITTLTGEGYELTPQTLLITDGNSDAPIGIAGIKGGKIAEVDQETTDIVLESANFNPAHTRKSSQILKLRTDASTRFENELAPEYAPYGLREVVALILDIAGGEAEGYVDIFPRQQSIPYITGVSLEEINSLLGTSVKEQDVEQILDRFGFVFERVSPIDRVLEEARKHEGVSYKYGASIRFDAPKAFDCSSFVSYVFSRAGVGVPRIAIDQYVCGEEVAEDDLKPGDVVFSIGKDTEARESFKRVADGAEVTVQAVKYQTIEYMPGTAVVSGVSHCGIYLGDGKVIHAAGKSSDNQVVVNDIAHDVNFANIVGYRRMVDTAPRFVVAVPFERLDLRIKEDLIEEIGRVYGYENVSEIPVEKEKQKVSVNKNFYYAEKIRDLLTTKGFAEVYTYSMGESGDIEIENPIAEDKKFLRTSLVGGLSGSLGLNTKNAPLFGGGDVRIFEIGKVFSDDIEYTSLGIASSNSKNVLEVLTDLSGELEQKIEASESNKELFVCNLDMLVANLPEPKEYDVSVEQKQVVYRPFSSYPFALRDIAVWVPEKVTADDLLEEIVSVAGDLLVQSSLFDEFSKDGRVSYAYRLVLQSPERTLSDEDIDAVMNRVTVQLSNKEGFEVR